MENQSSQPPSKPDNTPAPQPTPQPTATLDSYNYSSYSDMSKVSSSKHVKRLMIFLLAGALVLAIFSAVYFLILPSSRANSYTSNIKEPYNEQIDKMKVVYQSFSRPVFTVQTTTQAADEQDFAYAQNAIKDGKAATKSLEDNNKLSLSPGMSLLSSASKAQKQQQAIKDYVAKSNTYLDNYQKTVTYMEKFDQISYGQYQQLVTSISAIGNAKTISQYSTLVQNADTTLSKFTSDLRALDPSTDLKKFNDDLIADLGQMQTGFNDTNQALSSQNLTVLVHGVQEIQDASAKLIASGNVNIQDNLQHHSTLHNQITELETSNSLTN